MRFVNPNSVPNIPKSYRYTFNGKEYKIPWNSSVPWHSFYGTVRAFTERNGHPVPTFEQVEDVICQQLPKHACTGNAGYRPPPPVSKPCRSCGRRA